METKENPLADDKNLAQRFEDWAHMPIGKRMVAIRTIRKAKGMTLTQLAKASGLSVPYLSKLETGKRIDIKLSTLEKIATGLGKGVAFRAEFLIIGDHVAYYPVSVV